MYTALDVYAAQRALGSERIGEWNAYIEWHRLRREEHLDLDFDDWLATIPGRDLPALIDRVDEGLAPDDTGKASSLSLDVVG